jgi:hypothetical protein
MFTRMRVLTLGGLLLTGSLQADEPAKKDDKGTPIIIQIDLKGEQLTPVRQPLQMPTTIASAEELARVFPGKELQDRIKKAVNFDKQKLLYFAWSGSGQDRLDFSAVVKDKGPEVTFTFRPGLTRDFRSHFQLYALNKEASWSLKK